MNYQPLGSQRFFTVDKIKDNSFLLPLPIFITHGTGITELSIFPLFNTLRIMTMSLEITVRQKETLFSVAKLRKNNELINSGP